MKNARFTVHSIIIQGSSGCVDTTTTVYPFQLATGEASSIFEGSHHSSVDNGISEDLRFMYERIIA